MSENSRQQGRTLGQILQQNSTFAAVHRTFNNPKLRNVMKVLRYPLAVLAVAAIVHWDKPQWFFIGFGISMFGQAIQIWSFASLSKQKVLACRGPYCLVRNPMYVGRYFLLLGGVLLTTNLPLAAVFTVCYYFYVINRVAREEELLSGIFGEDYTRYCAQVNRFWPSLRTIDINNVCFFSWRLFWANNAHWNVLGVLVAYALIYFIV